MRTEITAVVPTHNRVRLLATTLRTILWQRDVDLEVLILDDGSTEDVRAALTDTHGARVRVIRHERAQGVCAARNRAASEANGDWLAFCDDDDLWAPDKLAAQLAAARRVGASWAYAGAVHVNIALRVLSAKHPPAPERLVGMLPCWSLMPGGSSNVIVRADAFAAAGGWDVGLINLADWDLWARLARQGTPACVNRPLVGYRIHPGNASADTGLILREAHLIDGRYGARLDYGELHHYLAWVHLRSGRRRPAVSHLARAAALGQLPRVLRTLGVLARARVGHSVPSFAPQPTSIDRAWMDESEQWIGPLRHPSSGA